MALLPMGGAPYLFDGGTTFNMRDGGDVVRVKITREALRQLEGPRRHPDFIAITSKHRTWIEYAAKLKFAGGSADLDGSITIRADDLHR